MYKLVAAVAVLALLAIPASADHQGDDAILAQDDLYVADDGVWEEGNDFGGLQREEFTTEHGPDGEVLDEEETIPADTEVLVI